MTRSRHKPTSLWLMELAASFHGGSLAVPTIVMPQGAVTLPRVIG